MAKQQYSSYQKSSKLAFQNESQTDLWNYTRVPGSNEGSKINQLHSKLLAQRAPQEGQLAIDNIKADLLRSFGTDQEASAKAVLGADLIKLAFASKVDEAITNENASQHKEELKQKFAEAEQFLTLVTDLHSGKLKGEAVKGRVQDILNIMSESILNIDKDNKVHPQKQEEYNELVRTAKKKIDELNTKLSTNQAASDAFGDDIQAILELAFQLDALENPEEILIDQLGNSKVVKAGSKASQLLSLAFVGTLAYISAQSGYTMVGRTLNTAATASLGFFMMQSHMFMGMVNERQKVKATEFGDMPTRFRDVAKGIMARRAFNMLDMISLKNEMRDHMKSFRVGHKFVPAIRMIRMYNEAVDEVHFKVVGKIQRLKRIEAKALEMSRMMQEMNEEENLGLGLEAMNMLAYYMAVEDFDYPADHVLLEVAQDFAPVEKAILFSRQIGDRFGGELAIREALVHIFEDKILNGDMNLTREQQKKISNIISTQFLHLVGPNMRDYLKEDSFKEMIERTLNDFGLSGEANAELREAIMNKTYDASEKYLYDVLMEVACAKNGEKAEKALEKGVSLRIQSLKGAIKGKNQVNLAPSVADKMIRNLFERTKSEERINTMADNGNYLVKGFLKGELEGENLERYNELVDAFVFEGKMSEATAKKLIDKFRNSETSIENLAKGRNKEYGYDVDTFVNIQQQAENVQQLARGSNEGIPHLNREYLQHLKQERKTGFATFTLTPQQKSDLVQLLDKLETADVTQKAEIIKGIEAIVSSRPKTALEENWDLINGVVEAKEEGVNPSDKPSGKTMMEAIRNKNKEQFKADFKAIFSNTDKYSPLQQAQALLVAIESLKTWQDVFSDEINKDLFALDKNNLIIAIKEKDAEKVSSDAIKVAMKLENLAESDAFKAGGTRTVKALSNTDNLMSKLAVAVEMNDIDTVTLISNKVDYSELGPVDKVKYAAAIIKASAISNDEGMTKLLDIIKADAATMAKSINLKDNFIPSAVRSVAEFSGDQAVINKVNQNINAAYKSISLKDRDALLADSNIVKEAVLDAQANGVTSAHEELFAKLSISVDQYIKDLAGKVNVKGAKKSDVEAYIKLSVFGTPGVKTLDKLMKSGEISKQKAIEIYNFAKGQLKAKPQDGMNAIADLYPEITTSMALDLMSQIRNFDEKMALINKKAHVTIQEAGMANLGTVISNLSLVSTTILRDLDSGNAAVRKNHQNNMTYLAEYHPSNAWGNFGTSFATKFSDDKQLSMLHSALIINGENELKQRTAAAIGGIGSTTNNNLNNKFVTDAIKMFGMDPLSPKALGQTENVELGKKGITREYIAVAFHDMGISAENSGLIAENVLQKYVSDFLVKGQDKVAAIKQVMEENPGISVEDADFMVFRQSMDKLEAWTEEYLNSLRTPNGRRVFNLEQINGMVGEVTGILSKMKEKEVGLTEGIIKHISSQYNGIKTVTELIAEGKRTEAIKLADYQDDVKQWKQNEADSKNDLARVIEGIFVGSLGMELSAEDKAKINDAINGNKDKKVTGIFNEIRGYFDKVSSGKKKGRYLNLFDLQSKESADKIAEMLLGTLYFGDEVVQSGKDLTVLEPANIISRDDHMPLTEFAIFEGKEVDKAYNAYKAKKSSLEKKLAKAKGDDKTKIEQQIKDLQLANPLFVIRETGISLPQAKAAISDMANAMGEQYRLMDEMSDFVKQLSNNNKASRALLDLYEQKGKQRGMMVSLINNLEKWANTGDDKYLVDATAVFERYVKENPEIVERLSIDKEKYGVSNLYELLANKPETFKKDFMEREINSKTFDGPRYQAPEILLNEEEAASLDAIAATSQAFHSSALANGQTERSFVWSLMDEMVKANKNGLSISEQLNETSVNSFSRNVTKAAAKSTLGITKVPIYGASIAKWADIVIDSIESGNIDRMTPQDANKVHQTLILYDILWSEVAEGTKASTDGRDVGVLVDENIMQFASLILTDIAKDEQLMPVRLAKELNVRVFHTLRFADRFAAHEQIALDKDYNAGKALEKLLEFRHFDENGKATRSAEDAVADVMKWLGIDTKKPEGLYDEFGKKISASRAKEIEQHLLDYAQEIFVRAESTDYMGAISALYNYQEALESGEDVPEYAKNYLTMATNALKAAGVDTSKKLTKANIKAAISQLKKQLKQSDMSATERRGITQVINNFVEKLNIDEKTAKSIQNDHDHTVAKIKDEILIEAKRSLLAEFDIEEAKVDSQPVINVLRKYLKAESSEVKSNIIDQAKVQLSDAEMAILEASVSNFESKYENQVEITRQRLEWDMLYEGRSSWYNSPFIWQRQTQGVLNGSQAFYLSDQAKQFLGRNYQTLREQFILKPNQKVSAEQMMTFQLSQQEVPHYKNEWGTQKEYGLMGHKIAKVIDNLIEAGKIIPGQHSYAEMYQILKAELARLEELSQKGDTQAAKSYDVSSMKLWDKETISSDIRNVLDEDRSNKVMGIFLKPVGIKYDYGVDKDNLVFRKALSKNVKFFRTKYDELMNYWQATLQTCQYYFGSGLSKIIKGQLGGAQTFMYNMGAVLSRNAMQLIMGCFLGKNMEAFEKASFFARLPVVKSKFDKALTDYFGVKGDAFKSLKMDFMKAKMAVGAFAAFTAFAAAGGLSMLVGTPLIALAGASVAFGLATSILGDGSWNRFLGMTTGAFVAGSIAIPLVVGAAMSWPALVGIGAAGVLGARFGLPMIKNHVEQEAKLNKDGSNAKEVAKWATTFGITAAANIAAITALAAIGGAAAIGAAPLALLLAAYVGKEHLSPTAQNAIMTGLIGTTALALGGPIVAASLVTATIAASYGGKLGTIFPNVLGTKFNNWSHKESNAPYVLRSLFTDEAFQRSAIPLLVTATVIGAAFGGFPAALGVAMGAFLVPGIRYHNYKMPSFQKDKIKEFISPTSKHSELGEFNGGNDWAKKSFDYFKKASIDLAKSVPVAGKAAVNELKGAYKWLSESQVADRMWKRIYNYPPQKDSEDLAETMLVTKAGYELTFQEGIDGLAGAVNGVPGKMGQMERWDGGSLMETQISLGRYLKYRQSYSDNRGGDKNMYRIINMNMGPAGIAATKVLSGALAGFLFMDATYFGFGAVNFMLNLVPFIFISTVSYFTFMPMLKWSMSRKGVRPAHVDQMLAYNEMYAKLRYDNTVGRLVHMETADFNSTISPDKVTRYKQSWGNHHWRYGQMYKDVAFNSMVLGALFLTAAAVGMTGTAYAALLAAIPFWIGLPIYRALHGLKISSDGNLEPGSYSKAMKSMDGWTEKVGSSNTDNVMPLTFDEFRSLNQIFTNYKKQKSAQVSGQVQAALGDMKVKSKVLANVQANVAGEIANTYESFKNNGLSAISSKDFNELYTLVRNGEENSKAWNDIIARNAQEGHTYESVAGQFKALDDAITDAIKKDLGKATKNQITDGQIESIKDVYVDSFFESVLIEQQRADAFDKAQKGQAVDITSVITNDQKKAYINNLTQGQETMQQDALIDQMEKSQQKSNNRYISTEIGNIEENREDPTGILNAYKNLKIEWRGGIRTAFSNKHDDSTKKGIKKGNDIDSKREADDQ